MMNPAPIIYEVSAIVTAELREAYEAYMTEQHIPDLMKTGCFVKASFETSGEGEYQMRYKARSREHLDTYFREHATRLRDDLSSHFPDGITLSRKEWNVIEHFA
jgi:hypothetical protein